MRKPGWYWVKDGGQWEPLWFNGEMWDGHHHDAEIREIGPRIPTPDEPWQCVPTEPTAAMKKAADVDTPGPMTAWKCWQVMLAAAPRPEDV